MDALFRTTKGYERKSPQYLSYSKIGEVMLHIVELKNGTIPRDDEHLGTRFRGVPVHDMRWDDPLIEKVRK
ncbi:hypothetical protein BDN71DRAFT_1458223 [Pleurotus eryngii]|uniref:Uncharacterized protein n=1 Tax=Pleurotus eryngii TaxID=5323 RepID=A0A9P5ZGM0_PLEER|nr:hypothetical protein BDN71DRAFT_1458223 [Pleurotus eryngii]